MKQNAISDRFVDITISLRESDEAINLMPLLSALDFVRSMYDNADETLTA